MRYWWSFCEMANGSVENRLVPEGFRRFSFSHASITSPHTKKNIVLKTQTPVLQACHDHPPLKISKTCRRPRLRLPLPLPIPFPGLTMPLLPHVGAVSPGVLKICSLIMRFSTLNVCTTSEDKMRLPRMRWLQRW